MCLMRKSGWILLFLTKGVPMYGHVLGRNVTVGAAAVLPATGSNRTLFITAAILFVAGVVTMVVSRLVSAKS